MLGQSYLPESFATRLKSGDLHGVVELCNSELYRDPGTVITKLDFKDDDESYCCVSTSSEEFIRILRRNAEKLGLDCADIAVNSKYFIVPEEIANLIIYNVRRSGRRLFGDHTFATIPKLDWELLVGTDEWRIKKGQLLFGDPYEARRVLPALAKHAEVPAACLSFELTDDGGLRIYMDKRIPLIGVYTSLFYEHQYDHETQNSMVELVNVAYDKSMGSIKSSVKLDYELVTLKNCAPFSRLQEHDSIDLSEDRLPFYWFDPREYAETPLGELKESLAIEDHWYNARYIMTYEFPADAMFLRTTVEKQQTKAGGGVEYIYLQNLDKHRIQSLGNTPQIDLSSTAEGGTKTWEAVFGKPRNRSSYDPYDVHGIQTWELTPASSNKGMCELSRASTAAVWQIY
jgi:hypothetical protein